jgi:hypothetical protein
MFCEILVYNVLLIIGKLRPSRSSNFVDVLECSTVACTYLEFHLLNRILWFVDGIRTCMFISVHNGLYPCVVVLSCTVGSAKSMLAFITLSALKLTLFQQGFLTKLTILFIVQIVVFTVSIILNKDTIYRISDEDIIFMSLRLCV